MLSQLGARIQHALRAFTPDDQKALKATVRTYPITKDYDLSTALTGLGTGEAIVTVLSEKGSPTPVAWTRIRAPRSLMAPAPDAIVTAAVAASALIGTYGQDVDRQSAYELLTARLAPTVPPPTPLHGSIPTAPAPGPTIGADGWPTLTPELYNPYLDESHVPLQRPQADPVGGLADVLSNPAVTSFMKSLGGALGRSIFGTRRRRH